MSERDPRPQPSGAADAAEHGLRRVGGSGLAYLDAGTPRRGTVLALHSLGTDHRVWRGQVPVLVDAGFRVLAPDARGHGASDAGAPAGPQDWVRDCRAVLDDAGAGEVHVLGVSMGCAQALELALAAPDRVASLVLTGGFGALEPRVAAQKAEGLAAGAASAGMAAWAERYAADTLVSDDPEAHALVREAVAGVSLAAYTASAQACFSPRSGDLAAVDVPALVVWGEQDHKTPEDLSTALAADLPLARLERLPGAGHLAPLDAPAAFAAVVLAFLDEVAAADAAPAAGPGGAEAAAAGGGSGAAEAGGAPGATEAGGSGGRGAADAAAASRQAADRGTEST